MKKTDSTIIDPKYIDVLDGIRALSVIIVMIFHFWQQTWIFPIIKTPFLKFLGIQQISFTKIVSTGYLFVDMMVMLSGFLLFLPVMRQIFLGEDMDSWKRYAKKRIARIVPSYYFSVLIAVFAFGLPTGAYNSPDVPLSLGKDLVTHLTFTHIFFVDTYFYTPCPRALWTVAVEVWFYVLFPFFAEMLKKRAKADEKKAAVISAATVVVLFLAFNAAASWWEKSEVMKPGVFLAFKINQLPSFMGAYANGMLGAMVFVLIAKHCERTPGLAAASTLLSVFTIIYIVNMMNECADYIDGDTQIWQVTERFRLTAAFTVLVISTALSARWYRFIFSNPLMRFLSGISYNLYIWHQWLAVLLKYYLRVPYWEGELPPNQIGDKLWMNRYALVITAAAFAAAIIATYCIEKPFSKLILGKHKKLEKAPGPPAEKTN